MNSIFSDRISDVPRSFIREILKVALDSSVISFAGGLPNRDLFPAEEIRTATLKVFEKFGRDIFQYSNSEGYKGLREIISERYRKLHRLSIPVDDILITSGSQQGLDLLGKIFLNDGDDLVIEEPGYLGAIQAFSIYQPRFNPVPVDDRGMDIAAFRKVLSTRKPRLMYTVPNFQNPSGISYPEENRRQIADLLKGSSTLLVEDDPYGELRFSGTPKSSFKNLIPDNTILLGSFSKTIVPGFRLGWIAASNHIIDRLLVAKQAADLHTCHFTQYVVYQYLLDNDIDVHIEKIKKVYGSQALAMMKAIHDYFPPGVTHTHPEGGMFLWATLPGRMNSRDLLERSLKEGVIFVPGDPFYVRKEGADSMRLNFSCVDEKTIRYGIQRLGKAIYAMCGEESTVH